ncbi:MAG: peptidoglycan editing factor PgeF [Bacteroidales bacterium]|jgi:YfiH family protein|nr:peptidoglycan editing factor PgeF [Bacteroidales bacterium]
MTYPLLKKYGNISFVSCRSNPLCIGGFSTRNGGVSKGPYYSLNLGLQTGDKESAVTENRQRFCNAIAPGYKVVHVEQIHSNIVQYVDKEYEVTQGDAFFTQEKNVLLTISTADCAPILIHDEEYSIIAAIHCGWRGAREKIIEQTIAQLSLYVSPENLRAYIGPMIQQSSYEVGAEFDALFPRQFIKKESGKRYFDLNSYIEDVLVESGVGRITNTRLCTYSNPDMFFSHRRDGDTGRMVSFIGLE